MAAPSSVDAFRERLLELKRRKEAEFAAKAAAAAAAAAPDDAVPPPVTSPIAAPTATAVSVAPIAANADGTGASMRSPAASAAPLAAAPPTVNANPSRPLTPMPPAAVGDAALSLAAGVVDSDGLTQPDFSKRSRRGNPPGTVRDTGAVYTRTAASAIIRAMVAPKLVGVEPLPEPVMPVHTRRPRSDDSLDGGGGRARSVSSDDSAPGIAPPATSAHRSEAGMQCAADACADRRAKARAAIAATLSAPLQNLPLPDGTMSDFQSLPRRRRARPATDYTRNRRISEGVYGVVYEGMDTVTRETYALKWIKEKWFVESKVGFPDYLLRELDLMQRFKHPNIVKGVCMATCKTVVSNVSVASIKAAAATPAHDTKLFLVAEYAGSTLRSEIYRSHEPLALSGVKWLLGQLLQGLKFMHGRHILHRDLKPSNVLVDSNLVVKLCDMGLARSVRPCEANLTGTVITLMYRPPELHFGLRTYDAAVDMWSIGCIAAEMLLRKPLFACTEDEKHLQVVCEIMGAPTQEAVFPGLFHVGLAVEAFKAVRVTPEAANADGSCYALPTSSMLAAQGVFVSSLRLRKHLLAARPDLEGSADGLALVDLIDRLLQWTPKARLSAGEALAHPFFAKGISAAVESLVERRAAYEAEKTRLRAVEVAAKADAAAAASLNLATAGEEELRAQDGGARGGGSDDDVDAPASAPQDIGVHRVARDDDPQA